MNEFLSRLGFVSYKPYTEGGKSSNSNTTKEIVDLFGRARKSIQVVTRTFPSNVYANKSMRNVLTESFSNENMNVEIITGPNPDLKSVNYFHQLGAKVYKLDKEPFQHFSIVDQKHVRVELPHINGSKSSLHRIHYDYRYTGYFLLKFFEEKSKSLPVEGGFQRS